VESSKNSFRYGRNPGARTWPVGIAHGAFTITHSLAACQITQPESISQAHRLKLELQPITVVVPNVGISKYQQEAAPSLDAQPNLLDPKISICNAPCRPLIIQCLYVTHISLSQQNAHFVHTYRSEIYMHFMHLSMRTK